MPLLYQKLTEIPVFFPKNTDKLVSKKIENKVTDRTKKAAKSDFYFYFYFYLNLSKKPFLPEPETSTPLALAKAWSASF